MMLVYDNLQKEMVMCRLNILAVGMLVVAALGCHAEAAAPSTQPGRGLRVGTYDPRAIAVAFAHSSMQRDIMKQKMDEMTKAKAAGDEKKIAELKSWGEQQQHKLHLQGFSGAPVDDILARVKDKLPQVAKRCGVEVIAGKMNYVGGGVAVVDVTDELVKLFEPSEKALKMIESLKKQPLVPEEAIQEEGKKGKI